MSFRAWRDGRRPVEFEFATATRIIFGAGASQQTAALVAGMGQSVLLVAGRLADRVAPLLNQLAARDWRVATLVVTGEPTIDTVRHGTQQARAGHCDVVIGFGGGSVLDTGKAIAALLTNGGEPLDYLEVIGRGKPMTQPAAPYVAIPTTAGTGAEVTRNAVLGSPEHQLKVSLRSPLMLPRLAIVDPQLTYGLPQHITAYTGLDALTQVMEPLVSNSTNPLTDAICRAGLQRAARSLPRVCAQGDDLAARADMALVSLFGGMALANAKLGAVHGIAGPFGGMFSSPHGATCAALLPHVMAANVRALRGRQPDSPALYRYEEVARTLTGSRCATALDGAKWVLDLCREVHIPPLSSYGCSTADFPALVTRAARASSMQGNPIKLTEHELEEILSQAL
ncbi:MAG: alcohol dehydrogenase [Planctomycetes bacterium RBG_16_64_10]|nr:MAG: alcohol dehydrogenase [Planctomycetes bacterium RBG_16_64_10]